MNKVLIALAVVSVVGGAFFLLNKPHTAPTSEVEQLYNQWKADYKINVGASENTYRLSVFADNYADIKEHNAKEGITYTMGLNEFSALTHEEFTATYLGLYIPQTNTNTNASHENALGLPTNVDWTKSMNPVKNQARCGSCWAFSAVGAIEGAHSAIAGNLYQLSEQELVDCSTSYGNNGCNGGLMDNAFQYVTDKGGLASATAYPYAAADGRCKAVSSRLAKLSGHVDVTPSNPEALKKALSKQPVSVAIHAGYSVFQKYKSGVFNDDSCGAQLDHGVVAVGYNTEGAIPYYIVRNSWGASWGENGHIRMGIKAGDGICGIQKMASYPTI